MKKIFSYLIFILINLLFLYAVFGFAFAFLADFLTSTTRYSIFPIILFYILSGSIAALASVILGILKPDKIFKILFLFEIPILFILIFNIIIGVRWNYTWLYYNTGILITLYLSFIFDLAFEKKNNSNSILTLRYFTHILTGIFGIYYALILLFYIIPLPFLSLKELFREPHFAFIGLFFSLFIFCVPSFMIKNYLFNLLNDFKYFKEQKKLSRAILFSLFLLTIHVATNFYLIYPSPTDSFKILKKNPNDLNEEEKREILNHQNQIKKALLNAYLAAYRYLASKNDVLISDLYQSAFHLSEKNLQLIDHLFKQLLYPFIYPGNSISDDQFEAQRLYTHFFDEDIQESEKQRILNQLKFDLNRSERSGPSTVLDKDSQTIYLAKQEIKLQTHGNWAEVEVFEAYENNNSNAQEVYYNFNLPSSAALTSLYLGETNDIQKRLAYQISPRGAASTIYRQETTGMRDPAILEKLGPWQYRLRVFPIPPSAYDRQTQKKDAGKMFLWFSYQTFKQEDGNWPLPILTEKRNVFWDKNTQRLLNQKPYFVSEESWMGKSLEGHSDNLIFPHLSEPIRLNKDWIAKFEKTGLSTPQCLEKKQNLKIAYLVDTSLSMQKNKNEIIQFFKNIPFRNNADVYLNGKQQLTTNEIEFYSNNEILYFGSTSLNEMNSQFQSQSSSKNYDLIFVLTDEGLLPSNPNEFDINTSYTRPYWVIHLGKSPTRYQYKTFDEIIQQGGGFTQSIKEAIQKAQWNCTLDLSTQYYDLENQLLWTFQNIQEVQQNQENREESINNFTKLAAAAWMEWKSRNINENHLEDLEAIHEMAKEKQIVSRYSSMIVLVNDRQKEALKKAEEQPNKFISSTQTDQAQIAHQSTLVSGTPEPEEWILIFIAGLFMIGILKKRNLSFIYFPKK